MTEPTPAHEPEPDEPGAALQREVWGVVTSAFEDRRVSEGLTQAELARRIGSHRVHVNHWLRTPDHMTLKAAAKLLAGMGLCLACVAQPLPHTMTSQRTHNGVSPVSSHRVSSGENAVGRLS